MKKRILVVAICICLCAVIAGSTIAYFSDTQTKVNSFTVGKADVDLKEDDWPENDPVDPTKPYKPEVKPGEEYAKKPYVVNNGTEEVYVRIKVDGLDCLDAITSDGADIVLKNLDSTNWTFYNGYYYYNSALKATEQTTYLFEGIIIPTTLENNNTSADFAVTVTADAVQTAGYTGSTISELDAWFTLCLA